MNRRALLFCFWIFLLIVGLSAGQESVDRDELLKRQKILQDRIEALKLEHDFLLFQKTAYASDSKYLIINKTQRKGQLKYKNRVLKDFSFISVSKNIVKLPQGKVILTKKIEEKGGQNALIFGSSLIVRQGGVSKIKGDAKRSSIILRKKDFLSVFYALEQGATAYVVF